ncbi:MAG: hypothetical protein ABJF10_20640 [Chthoniobacter sp.]|uniref:hypothetical protein n=1 Tax=Chthoniobacter sp. TaxID=2510640 RepID=UPI0032AC9436
MNTEPTTMNDDAASRRMIASWTDSLLRLRARPAANPPRGEWRFATTSARDSKDGYRTPAALQN